MMKWFINIFIHYLWKRDFFHHKSVRHWRKNCIRVSFFPFIYIKFKSVNSVQIIVNGDDACVEYLLQARKHEFLIWVQIPLKSVEFTFTLLLFWKHCIHFFPQCQMLRFTSNVDGDFQPCVVTSLRSSWLLNETRVKDNGQHFTISFRKCNGKSRIMKG